MSDKLSKVLIFVAGAACGAAVTNYLVKSKYEQLVQEEIDSVKETYARMLANKSDEDDISEDTETMEAKKKAEVAKEKPSIIEYAAMLQKQGYTSYSDASESSDSNDEEEYEDEESEEEEYEEEEQESAIDKPYVIAPEEFGEYDDYEEISLRYYADGILTDDQDELVEDVEETVGFDSLNKFGLYEDDSVHVRNDRLKADYEILRSTSRYSDVRKNTQHYTEE